MKVEQYVMAYRVEQDRLRAFLPEGFESLRPVLRINVEIREDVEEYVYWEYNTPVAGFGRRGWLNISHWESPASSYRREGETTIFTAPSLKIAFTRVGIAGGCPAEQDNEGCFFLGEKCRFLPAERIGQGREFCGCTFAWDFGGSGAHGASSGGKSVPAAPTELKVCYPRQAFTPENAAAIPCEQVLGAYVVRFAREAGMDCF